MFKMSISTIAKRAAVFCETDKYYDVEFILNYGASSEKVKGHRLIFAFASDVFERMLYGELAEGNTISLMDDEPAAFKTMKRFIYSNEVHFESMCHAINVFSVTNKYNIAYLVLLAEEYISANLSPSTVLRVLAFSRKFCKDDLEETCIQIIRNETVSVLNSDDFMLCDVNLLMLIVSETELNISESELFKYVENWAKMNVAVTAGDAEEKDLLLIKEVVYKIRFLAMSAEEFVRGPGVSPLLTQDERLALLMNINVPGSLPLPEKFSSLTFSRRAGAVSSVVSKRNSCLTYGGNGDRVTVCQDDNIWSVKLKTDKIGISSRSTCYRSPYFDMGGLTFQFILRIDDKHELRISLICINNSRNITLQQTEKFCTEDISYNSRVFATLDFNTSHEECLLYVMNLFGTQMIRRTTDDNLNIEIDFKFLGGYGQ